MKFLNNTYPILVEMPFGSHLYGTATERSDLDYKCVFVPTIREAFLGQMPRHIRIGERDKAEGEKNLPGEVDKEYISIQEFIKLALEGQTMAIDMLHAKKSILIYSDFFWTELVNNRHRFYTKNLTAFIGYAKRQAAKYGIKGSRIATAKIMVDMLGMNLTKRIEELDFSGIEHASKTDDESASWEILGKRLTNKAFCAHYLPTFERYLQAYGERARMAETNQGIDWKAMSHAVRAAYEVDDILSGRELELPLDPCRALDLMGIKLGVQPFKKVQMKLEMLIDVLEMKSKASALPEQPDFEWANDFVYRVMKFYGVF